MEARVLLPLLPSFLHVSIYIYLSIYVYLDTHKYVNTHIYMKYIYSVIYNIYMSVFLFVYMCVGTCLYAGVPMKVRRGCQIPLDLDFQVVVSQPMWVLGIVLGL